MNIFDHQTLDERQKLTDLLCSQKYLTGVYNTYCCESETPAVRNCLFSILQEEHRIQEEIFRELQTHGGYAPEKAEETKINAEKQKFAQSAKV